MRLFYSICFILLCFNANSQRLLKGMVLDEEKNKPIPAASVFLNTTSFGTVTNKQGNFELTIPNGKYELIVSSIGYDTYNLSINADNVPEFITIKLKTKSQVMETVIIEPYEKDGWEKWGKFFLENFIGTSENSFNCTIKNKEVIYFRNSKKTNELTAIAHEPLVIENKALGYTLKYQLEMFSYNFKSHYLLYVGYPLFQPMVGKDGQERRWEKRRSEAYYGSMTHFMKSVYENSIAEEGFEVRLSQKIPNLEKQRVEAIYPATKLFLQPTTEKLIPLTPTKDSIKYYEKVLHQADSFTTIVPVLSADVISSKVDSSTIKLDFKNYLQVIYKKKTAPFEYRQLLPKNGTTIMSQIILINKRPIEILSNGNYYNPLDLMSTGYWAWSEKIANMLPFDYKPSKP